MFCETFGDVFLDHISRKELVAWINKLPYSGQTKTNYKDIIRAAWSYFDDREWLSKNVAVKLPVERIVRGEIGILKVEEVEQLLRANENYDPEICGLMALGLFAGMRSSAITRVAYEEINFKERGIKTFGLGWNERPRARLQCANENLKDAGNWRIAGQDF